MLMLIIVLEVVKVSVFYVVSGFGRCVSNVV